VVFFVCRHVNEFGISLLLAKDRIRKGSCFHDHVAHFHDIMLSYDSKNFEIPMIFSQMPTSLCKLADLTSVQLSKTAGQLCSDMSVVFHCWLGDRKSIRPVKVGCWFIDGVDFKWSFTLLIVPVFHITCRHPYLQ